MLHFADGSDIAGTRDEARVQGCCPFATLLGDQGVTIGSPEPTIRRQGLLRERPLVIHRGHRHDTLGPDRQL